MCDIEKYPVGGTLVTAKKTSDAYPPHLPALHLYSHRRHADVRDLSVLSETSASQKRFLSFSGTSVFSDTL